MRRIKSSSYFRVSPVSRSWIRKAKSSIIRLRTRNRPSLVNTFTYFDSFVRYASSQKKGATFHSIKPLAVFLDDFLSKIASFTWKTEDSANDNILCNKGHSNIDAFLSFACCSLETVYYVPIFVFFI